MIRDYRCKVFLKFFADVRGLNALIRASTAKGWGVRGGGSPEAAPARRDGEGQAAMPRHSGIEAAAWWRGGAGQRWPDGWQAGHTDRPTGWSVPPSEGIAATKACASAETVASLAATVTGTSPALTRRAMKGSARSCTTMACLTVVARR